jgi:thiamine biosynthesis lipoprotein ApbE
MLADALATAAFVLGPRRGIEFLEEHGAEGMAVSRELERFETPGFTRYRI